MSGTRAATLSGVLNTQKKQYLAAQGTMGGTASGFRERINADYRADKLKYESLLFDAVMEASTKNWQQPPRKSGPDLFCIGGMTIPETLTRPAAYAIGDGDEHEEFEKVDSQFGTVSDLLDDAMIKLRKAAQSATAAEVEMKIADEAKRRAGGKMTTLLRELADVE
jgi:hypothetical protein